MDKKLLVDYMPFIPNKTVLNEALSKNGKLLVSGMLQRSGVENQNGRVYPDNILKREATKYDTNFVSQNRAMGELDHPESSVVNLKNVSHNVVKMWWDGDKLMGEVEILTTPSGNILKELLKCGITLGISSRGMGSVKKLSESTVEVQDDFELIAFDFVSNPSTMGAFMTPEARINESKSVVINPLTNKWEAVESIVRDILEQIK